MASLVALVLGAGPNSGNAIGRNLAAQGYKLALVSRKANESESTDSELRIAADFADPSSIPGVFDKVKAKLGIPSVVVYNAGALNPTNPADPLSLPWETVTKTLNINAISAYAAAQHAVAAWAELPASSTPPTFIFTGNCTNVQAIPPLLDLGISKSAAAHFIEIASMCYLEKYKFYYADQREEDGTPMYNGTDGEAHGKFYAELAAGSKQGPWHQTFVKGIGYKKF